MRRRDFVTLVGGAPIAWPLAAHAQQPTMPVIGFLHPSSPNSMAGRLRGFRQGLKEAGYYEHENVSIEYRWAEDQYDRLPELAADLIRRRVAVIAVIAGTATLAAKAATTTIPIVFVASEDPVKLGLVASLARPGGNLTGINLVSAELAAKRLELLHESIPAATRVALLVNPDNTTTTETTIKDVEAAARAIGLQIRVLNASTGHAINAAYSALGQERLDAVFVGLDPLFTSLRAQLVHLAMRHLVPASYGTREFADAGGLMSYGSSIADAWRQAGTYAGRILKGIKPADLPVVQASKYELVINLKTAKALGLVIPESILLSADELVE